MDCGNVFLLFTYLLQHRNSCSFELDVWEQTEGCLRANKQNSECCRWTKMFSLAFFAIIQPERLSGHISTDFVQEDCPRYIKRLFKNGTYNSKRTSQDNHNRLSQVFASAFSLRREKNVYIEWQNPPFLYRRLNSCFIVLTFFLNSLISLVIVSGSYSCAKLSW